MAATPQQRLGNAPITTIPEHFKDKMQSLFTTSSAPDQQKEPKHHQDSNTREK